MENDELKTVGAPEDIPVLDDSLVDPHGKL